MHTNLALSGAANDQREKKLIFVDSPAFLTCPLLVPNNHQDSGFSRSSVAKNDFAKSNNEHLLGSQRIYLSKKSSTYIDIYNIKIGGIFFTIKSPF